MSQVRAAGLQWCSIEDVAALLGVPVESLDPARTTTLIELATGVLSGLLCEVPTPVPDSVRYVTASMTTRQMANPQAVASEQVAGYRVQYASAASAGLMPTEAELRLVSEWLCVNPGATVGQRAYTSALRLPTAPGWPWDWWQRDLDQLDETR